jgi:hypothetical protein
MSSVFANQVTSIPNGVKNVPRTTSFNAKSSGKSSPGNRSCYADISGFALFKHMHVRLLP